jgi:hypothetical protein
MRYLTDPWLYEAVRLSEQQSGWVDDSAANQQAINTTNDGLGRLWSRAKALAPALALEPAVAKVRTNLKLSALLLCFVALVLGVSAGLTALGQAQDAVNVIWALLALLLVPTASFVLWAVSCFVPQGRGGFLGQIWEWLANRWLSQGKTALAWRAWVTVAQQRGAQRWWLAVVTHGIWAVLLIGVVAALLAAFSLRHYTFVWQTTWLDAEVFVGFAHAIGAWPGLLGFDVPSANTILLSGNAAVDSPEVRQQWAHWLVGCVIAWGLLPRLIALIVTAGLLGQCYRSKGSEPSDAYALVALARMEKQAQKPAFDDPSGPTDVWPQALFLPIQEGTEVNATVSIETASLDDIHAVFGGQVHALMRIEDRASRQQVKAQLQAMRPKRLLMIVDAQHTPDRGVFNTLLALTPHVVQARLFLQQAESKRNRVTQWQEKSQAVGMGPPLTDWSAAVQWMNGHD